MPQNNHLNAVTYGAGQFVAVGDGGAVITSPDGFNWTWRPSGTPLALRAITYGAGLFVALGGQNGGTENTIFTSPDGVAWRAQQMFPGADVNGLAYDGTSWTTDPVGRDDTLFGVVYGAGRYAALGEGFILSSPDGIDWNTYTANWKVRLNAGSCSLSICVAVGESGQILTSPDLINWTPRVMIEPDQFAGAGFDGTQFVATSAWYSLTSPDGINWTSHKVWDYWRMHRVI